MLLNIYRYFVIYASNIFLMGSFISICKNETCIGIYIFCQQHINTIFFGVSKSLVPGPNTRFIKVSQQRILELVVQQHIFYN